MPPTGCKQTPFRAVIVMASHNSRGPRTRARVTARSMNWRLEFFLRSHVCHSNKRTLY